METISLLSPIDELLKELLSENEKEDLKLIRNTINNFYSKISLKILKSLYIIKKDQESLNKKEDSFLKKLFSPKVGSSHLKYFKIYIDFIYNNIPSNISRGTFIIYIRDLRDLFTYNSYINDHSMECFENGFNDYLNFEDTKTYESFKQSF